MLNQAFIAIIADRFNLSTQEVLEVANWITDRVDWAREFCETEHYIEMFQSFQRQESNEALASDFLSGRAFGFNEVSYDSETGEQLPMEWMTPVEELASWAVVFDNL
jgi:hypothetical protein